MSARFALLTIRNGVTACMMIAAAALLSVEAIGPAHALVLAGAILYGRARRTAPGKARLWDALALIALFLFPVDLFVLSRDLIGAALRLLTFVIIYRCSNLTDPRDLRQAISLSFVQILAAAASTTEIRFSLFLAAYLFMAIWTLMAMASARDDAPVSARRPPSGRPVAMMTASTIAIGSVMFFLIPHFGTGVFRPSAIGRPGGDGLTGFAERIELGSIGRIKKGRAIVMRVRVDGASGRSTPTRWRGVALDSFDGRSWSASHAARTWIDRGSDGAFHVGDPMASGRPTFSYEVSVLPVLVPVLFTSPGPARILSEDLRSVGVDPDGGIHLPSPLIRRFNYRVVSEDPETALAGYDLGPGADDSHERTHYLELPRIDPRVNALTWDVASGSATDHERAARIEEHLRGNYAYSLDIRDEGVADPLAHFLIDRNAGHCEYFATAMAVMLRHLEIPSRVVTGFAAGEWSGLTSSWIVRQSDAHAWVEAWLPGRGWVTFDPTPSQGEIADRAGAWGSLRGGLARIELLWDTWIIGLDLLDQQSVAESIADAARALAAGAGRFVEAVTAMIPGSGAPHPAVLAGAFGLLAAVSAGVAVAALRAILGRRSAPAPCLAPMVAAQAARRFRRFEARWAARGVRRHPGQTPMELAREIARTFPEATGHARSFVEGYYRSRYGD